MNEEQLKALIAGNVNDSLARIRAVADQLSPADLARLEELEAGAANRATLLTAIDSLMADSQAGQQDGGDASAEDGTNDEAHDSDDHALGIDAVQEKSGKATRGEHQEEWMKPDYSGPITIEMAEWRNKHLVTK